MVSKEYLAQITLGENRAMPDNYRCHEAARQISNKIKSLDINASAKSGIVTYDTSYFRDKLSDGDIFLDFSEDAKRELLLANGDIKNKVRVFHSWVEIPQENDSMVIDWHFHLRLSADVFLDNILIVDSKNNLPHVYNPIAMEMGKWVIFVSVPPYATRLRT